MSRIVITGAVGGSVPGAESNAPNRLEITDLVNDETQFSLYIQALSEMFSASQDDPMSFFQIAAIHGLPYTPWNGAVSTKPDRRAWRGYCTHGSVLFPTWHRPYVALFEQSLQQHAIKIAKRYTEDPERWTAGAANLRAPYWDWARNSVPPPEVIELAKVTVITPEGRREVDNPLMGYRFHPIDRAFPAPYSGWRTTLRHPTDGSSRAQNDIQELKDALGAEGSDIRVKTFTLLSRVRTWPVFSNHTSDGGSGSSLEGIHDSIHVLVGDGGHMSDPAAAGFDPIFFLHHANVDRLLSLWSALNPGVWVTSGRSGSGSRTIPSNSAVNGSTELAPFNNSQASYWISTQTNDTTKLNYTYPEFNGLDTTDPAGLRIEIAQRVTALYSGPPPTIQAFVTPSALPASAAPAELTRSIPQDIVPAEGLARGAVSVESLEPAPASTAITEWSVRVRFKKFELGGSGSVLIFLGPLPEVPTNWCGTSSFVGAVHVFANSVPEQCENCQDQNDVEVQGFVHLNEHLAKNSGLNSFDPEVVVPYLERELRWQVLRANRTPADLSELPSLQVGVYATPMTLEPGDVFPTPGERQHFHQITENRAGGCRCQIIPGGPVEDDDEY